MALQANREIFRAIDGYDSYEVSNHGRIRNVNTARILKPANNGHGYLFVVLYKNGRPKHHKVHRLVASAFCNNPNDIECTQVDHIDRNRSNNTPANLRWCTSIINQRNKGRSKKNTSGVTGVNFHKNCWVANWRGNDQKQHSKSFSVNKYDNAKDLAIAFRRQKEAELGYL